MGLHHDLKHAFSVGQNWHEVYRNVKPYYATLRRFIDREYFGLTGSNGQPYHCNPKHDPCPVMDHHTGMRRPARFGHRQLLQHLLSQDRLGDANWAYLVNSPATNLHLLAVDIDCDLPRERSDAMALARQISKEIFAGKAFIEPSRHRCGAYVWFKIVRSSDPEQFNRQIALFGKFLKDRYHGRFHAQVCGIKGTLHYLKPNSQYDFYRWLNEGFKYQHHKETYARGEFHYDEHLEPHIHERGTLITMPLAGAWTDESGYERCEQFLRFMGDPANTVEETQIDRQFLREMTHRTKVTPVFHRYDEHRPRTSRRSKAHEMLVQDADPFRSRIGAILVELQENGLSATPEGAMNRYEQDGAATGPRHRERIRWFEDRFGLFAKDFDPSRRKGHDEHWFTDHDLKEYAKIVNRKLPQHIQRKLKREGYTGDDLRLFYAFFRKNIKKQAGQVPYASIRAGFGWFARHRGFSLSITDEKDRVRQNHRRIRRLLDCFIRYDLIRCVDASYRPRSLDPQGKGRCRRYALVELLQSLVELLDKGLRTTVTTSCYAGTLLALQSVRQTLENDDLLDLQAKNRRSDGISHTGIAR